MKYSDLPPVEPNTSWVNYGDVNPKIHGGMWVRYQENRETWLVVRTFVWSDVMPEGSENIAIETYHIEPQDVFIDGNPENGPTGALEWVIDQFDVAYETALADRPIEYWLADFPYYADYGRSEKTVKPEEYWAELEKMHDITPYMS